MYDLEGVIQDEGNFAAALNGLAGGDSPYTLEGLGLADVAEYGGDALMGVLGATKQTKNRYPGMSVAHAQQVARRLKGLPIDRGSHDAQAFCGYHIKDVTASNALLTSVDFFTASEQIHVTNLRQGTLEGDSTAIISGVSASVVFGSVNANNGGVTLNTETTAFTATATVETMSKALRVLLEHGIVTLNQRGRPRMELFLSELVAGNGLSVAGTVFDSDAAAGSGIASFVNGSTDPRARMRLPDPILILPDLPIRATLKVPTAQAVVSSYNIALKLCLHGERIAPGGLGK